MFFVVKKNEDKDRVLDYFNNLVINEQHSIEIKPYKRNRSKAQNRLMWEWIGIISNDLGYSKEEMHDVFKVKFLEPKIIQDPSTGDTMKVPGSTKRLNTKEFTEHLEKIEAFAQMMDIRLPKPDDYMYAMEGK